MNIKQLRFDSSLNILEHISSGLNSNFNSYSFLFKEKNIELFHKKRGFLFGHNSLFCIVKTNDISYQNLKEIINYINDRMAELKLFRVAFTGSNFMLRLIIYTESNSNEIIKAYKENKDLNTDYVFVCRNELFYKNNKAPHIAYNLNTLDFLSLLDLINDKINNKKLFQIYVLWYKYYVLLQILFFITAPFADSLFNFNRFLLTTYLLIPSILMIVFIILTNVFRMDFKKN